MSNPAFPDPCFPNVVTVRLCGVSVNSGGGYSPVADSGTMFPVSVQVKSTRWDDRDKMSAAVSYVVVYFQTDPSLSLSRPIRQGDRIDAGDRTLNVLGPAENRGGFDFLWRVRCESVNA